MQQSTGSARPDEPGARPPQALFLPPIRDRVLLAAPADIVHARLQRAFETEIVRAEGFGSEHRFRGVIMERGMHLEIRWRGPGGRSWRERRLCLGVTIRTLQEGALLETVLWDLQAARYVVMQVVLFVLLLAMGLYAHPLRMFFVLLFFNCIIFVGHLLFLNWVSVDIVRRLRQIAAGEDGET